MSKVNKVSISGNLGSERLTTLFYKFPVFNTRRHKKFQSGLQNKA
jgi:hypothetical protein